MLSMTRDVKLLVENFNWVLIKMEPPENVFKKSS